MIADSENVLYNNPVNIKNTYTEEEVSHGISVEGLVVLASYLRDGLVLLTPSSPWTNGEWLETQGALRDLSLFFCL